MKDEMVSLFAELAYDYGYVFNKDEMSLTFDNHTLYGVISSNGYGVRNPDTIEDFENIEDLTMFIIFYLGW